MKTCTLFLICISFLLPLKSFSNYVKDSTITKHEFSTSYDLSTFNHINFNYSRKISQNNWLKFGANFSGSYFSSEPITQTIYPTSSLSFGTTFSIGLDHHKLIKSNFDFISGFNLRLISGFLFSKVENPDLPVRMQRTTTTDFSYGIGGSFGIYYKVSENFSIGSSINPLIIFSRSSNATSNTTSVKLYLTDMSLICLRYKF